MSEIKEVNKYEERVGGHVNEVELTPFEQLKHTAHDAKDKALNGVNDAVKWAVENPKKAVAAATGALVTYNTLIKPLARDICKFRQAHTYEFYDFKNHESLRIRRKLTPNEYKELALYLSDPSKHRFASDWLRARGLLKGSY